MEDTKESELGLVPQDWKMVLIEDLGNCVTGTTPRTSVEDYYVNPEIDFIAPADLGFHKFVTSSEKKISNLGLSVVRALPKNSVMCVCIGSSIGKIGMSSKEISATNQQINSIICDNKFNPEFIYYVLRFHSKYWSNFATPSPVPILSKGRFEKIDIYVTTCKKEQNNISKILSLIQGLILIQIKIIDKLSELKKLFIHKIFSEGLNKEQLKKSSIGNIPKSWELISFGEIADFKNGINFGSEQKGNKGVLTIDVLNMYGLDYKIDYKKLYRINKNIDKSFILNDGDILFVRSSLKREGVGWASLFTGYEEPITFCGFIIRARLKEKIFNPIFLTYYFRTEYIRNQMIAGSGKVSITNINQSILKNILIPKPSMEEQNEIVDTILTIESKLKMILSKKESSEQLFNNLLHQLMTGKIRVKDLEL